ncbi:hypothetical protein D3C80_1979040 [compost metagenome]
MEAVKIFTSGWASATALMPSGAATSTMARISLQPAFFSRSMVATMEPPVASIGSMIMARRSSISGTSFSR